MRILCLIALMAGFSSPTLAPGRGALPSSAPQEVPWSGLPPELEGKFPLQLPQTEGQVRQMLLLNNRWLILAVYDLPELAAELNRLSGGALQAAVERQQQAEARGGNDWAARKELEKIQRQWLAEARENLGERKLEDPRSLEISSPNDPAYASPKAPLRVTRTFVSLGGNRVPGLHETDYAHYLILELPHPLQQGHDYVISLPARGSVRFTYDEFSLVSRASKINQAGYLFSSGRKFAYLGAWGAEFGPVPFDQAKTFEVVEVATGDVALTGPVTLRERNPRFAAKPGAEKNGAATDPRPLLYGEDVYEMDLSDLSKEGIFFLRIPGVGRSWPFRHGPQAYGEAFYTAARGLYHQRAATALERPFTWWTRPKSRMHDTIYEADYLAFPPQAEAPKDFPIFDAVGGTIRKSPFTEDVIGGWYDAADWDRNQSHFLPIFDLLHVFEAAPEKFTDGQLHLPESGNGIPDLLDEALWGIECWRRSQDASGGVSGFIETNAHPAYEDPRHRFAFSRRTRWNSLLYAAAAAQLARLLQPYASQRSEELAASALRAWEFGTEAKNALGKITLTARQNRGRGPAYTREWEETDAMIAPYRVAAALQLNRLTGDPAYLRDLARWAAIGQRPFAWKFTHRDFSVWLYADLARDPERRLDPALVAKWRRFYIESADALLQQLEQMPYRQTWPREKDFYAGWGASVVTNFNRNLFLAWQLTGDRKYLDAIALNTDFMLGANPLGLCWTTGIGLAYPIAIQHKTSELDGILDPVPGLTVYGINGGPALHPQGRDWIWNCPGKDGPVAFLKSENRDIPFYRRWAAHPRLNTAQCEFTIHETTASTIFSTAVLLGAGWQPDPSLRERGPRREEYLFGSWPLP